MTSSSPSPSALICGFGAATPVGRSALAAAAAIRAGITAHGDHPFMVDSEGEPMRVAQCAWMAAEALIDKRLIALLTDAVHDAATPLVAAQAVGPKRGAVLLVNVPPLREGLPPKLDQLVHQALLQAFPNVFACIEVIQAGHAGGFVALRSAQRVLAAGAPAAIVAGVDSFVQPETLEWLEETDQLHGAGPRNNAWGFVPGEGAGAVLMMTRGEAKRIGLTPFARIVGVGVGQESELIRSGSVCLGKGLTAAFEGAFGSLPEGVVVTDVYCDMNGEPYRADEYGFTVTRLRERFVSASDFIAPADCWGDVGAASAPLALMLASIAMQKGYAAGPLALVWGSSDAGERGAAVLEGVA